MTRPADIRNILYLCLNVRICLYIDIWKWSLRVEAFFYLPNYFGSQILSLLNYLWKHYYNTEWERIDYSRIMPQ